MDLSSVLVLVVLLVWPAAEEIECHSGGSKPSSVRTTLWPVVRATSGQRIAKVSRRPPAASGVSSAIAVSASKWSLLLNRTKDMAKEPPHNVTILALLDLSLGASLLQTAQVALNQINTQRVVPGFRLQLLVNDSKCDSGAGVDAFFHAIYTRKERRMRPFIMILGPGCSQVTESVASVTARWNIVQISHGATSAALSDRKKYPLFFRTAAAESTHNAARVAFLQHFRWDAVSVIAQNQDDYTLVVNDLCALLDDSNTTVSNLLTFSPTEFAEEMETLSTRDARIIIGSFSPAMAVPIFCEVFHRKLYGADHVWIVPESVLEGLARWTNPQTSEPNSTCTWRNLRDAIEGVFGVKTHRGLVNITNTDYQTLQEVAPIPAAGSHGEIYDAVWTMALALRGLIRKRSPTDFNYDSKSRKEISDQLMKNIASLRFRGASGLVSFMGANRIGTTALFQIQGGVPKQIGLFHPDLGLDVACNECWPVRWLSGQVPVATRTIKYRINTIDPAAFYAMALLAALGIVLALICLIFNLVKRKLKYIKLSSPKLNNIAIAGTILFYGAVFLLGIDHATLLHESSFPIICMGRVYFLSAGFSLAFGAMFTKTFRVHRIFARRNSLLKNKLLADTQLIGLILVLLLVDTVVVSVWIGLDPMERNLRNLTMVVDPEDRTVVYQPQVEVCRSNHSSIWLGFLYISKGLLLVGGLYMAWETRNVAIPALNDSPYIGMNVYNTVITSLAVVSCDRLLSDRTTLAYVVVATLILTSTTTALCLLFLPKFHAVWRQAGHPEINAIDQSTGLKMEFNTRRMVVDDRKELLCRAEIMNRVYLRDIAELDADISRLERLLAKEELDTTPAERLDTYSSAIQAEVTQLYAKLERDELDGSDWTFFDGANASRSCVSLCDGKGRDATAKTRCRAGWGSASCLVHKRRTVAAKCMSVRQSSLITLLQLNVDNQDEDAVYQLVDRTLIGTSKSGPLSSDYEKPVTGPVDITPMTPPIKTISVPNRQLVFTFRL